MVQAASGGRRSACGGGKQLDPRGAAALGVLLAANFTLVIGRHTGRWDSSDFFCPYFMLVADHARHGELLLWTPLVEGGLSGRLRSGGRGVVAAGGGTGGRAGAERGRLSRLLALDLGAGRTGCLVLGPAFSARRGWAAWRQSLTCSPPRSPTRPSSPPTWWSCRPCRGHSGGSTRPGPSSGCCRPPRPAPLGLAALAGYPALTIIGGCWLAAWAARGLCSPAGEDCENSRPWPSSPR